ncbi:MAG: RNase adapter RapZ [Actinomycetaceae bacterium]|nr:RNase adapter RapZ [Actinomycetaceae bacterium]MDY6083200.1 RNase adapter RapZ [Actinomycetaceae bacterium]
MDINDTGLIPLGIAAADEEASLPENHAPEVLVITGMSGAGRTRAGITLEDLGWYVVDNIPPRLLRSLTGLMTSGSSVTRLAVIVDVRGRSYFSELISSLSELTQTGVAYRIMFLDCSDDELVRRYENVRRPHPLQGDGPLLVGIQRERELLSVLKERADIVIDTTTYSVHDLSRKVRAYLGNATEGDPQLTVMSFGFKYGIPIDADNVADVRFLPNPYWISELRHLTGHDKAVADFVLSQKGAREFVDRYAQMMADVMAGFAHELKPSVTIAIGCTGGKHRSVAIAEALSERLRELGHPARTVHRDLGRE